MKSLFALSALTCLVASCNIHKADGTFSFEGNPLIRNKFTADPAPMVSNGRLYLYVGHDEYYAGQDSASGGKEFNITEWLCYSTSDMKTWTDHGSVLRPSHFAWADTITAKVGTAWAAQVVERNGKFYYYTTVQGSGQYKGYAIGVAVSDSPTGPFVDAIGAPLVCDTMTSNGTRGWWNDIDPTVFVDGDEAWIAWGNGTCFMARLKDNMTELDGDIITLNLPRYVEGPWLNKRNGVCYLVYASMGKMREAIDYATAPSFAGPWTHRGQLTGEAENSFTIHPGIAEFNGKNYLFYHNATLTIDGIQGAIGRRSVCVDELTYSEDGLMNRVSQTAQNQGYSFTSPSGLIKVLPAISDNGVLSLNVARLHRNADIKCLNVDSLALITGEKSGLKLIGVDKPIIVADDYDMILGKRSHCTPAATERILHLVDNNGTQQDVAVRAYDDGVAFRYILPQGGNVQGETTTFDMNMSQNRWLQKYDISYEGFFEKNTADTVGAHYGFPSLFELSNGLFALLTEGNVHQNNSAASLWGNGNLKYGVDAQENVGQVDNGWVSPWRIAIVGELSDIVESTLVNDVSEPNKIGDTSWIQTGVASWIYWAYNHGSNDYKIIKEYVDMAVALKLPYVLIDAEWDEMKDGKTIEDAVKYAVDKGIKPMIWYNSSVGWIDGAPGPKFRLNKPEDREKEFSWLESIGVKGVKIDFFSGDDVRNISYYIDLLESAARHHLVVNFHGATLPRGWQRTYPNLVSTEAVYGAEWYNNAPTLTNKAATHNATLPFTRGVVGSMDYTPCTFTDSQHPHITTDAHELALTVLFESAVLHLADRPSAYLSQPKNVQNFLSTLPTAWDDTRFLSGYPGKSVVLARRSGNTWYVAGINGLDEEQEVQIPLNRLNRMGLQIDKCTLIQDGNGKWNISTPKEMPTSITLKPRGGFIAVINSNQQ